MNKSLSLISTPSAIQTLGTNASTGLAIFDSMQAPSGFCYQLGMRDSHGLLIIEGIAEGTACTYLCGIQVRDKLTGEEICSVDVERNTRYSRKTVMDLVHRKLCATLAEGAIKEGKAMNQADVEAQVAEMLDDCYFSESRRAALRWAESVGIFR